MTTGPQPTFLVIGAARSGTTGLVEGLRQHPDVFVTEPKEPHFFALHGRTPDFSGPGDAATINRVAVTDAEQYFGLYAGAGGALARGDGSVSTLYYHDDAIPEILRVNPEMRLVLLLREPVARAFSSWQYMRARGFEPIEDFGAAVEAEPGRREQNYHHLWHYTSMSRYADAVEAFAGAFDPTQLGIWFFDDLDSDYPRVLGEVLEFIGVSPAGRDDAEVPRVNISGRPRSRLLHRMIWAATRNETLRSGVKRATSYRFREAVRRLALQRSSVPQEAVRALSPIFEDDLARLRAILELLGRDPGPSWLSGVDERRLR